MSVMKTQETKFHTSEQQVKHRMYYLRMDGLDESGFPSLRIGAGFRARVDGTEGVVDEYDVTGISKQDVVDKLSSTEKQAGRVFLAALEREFALKTEALKDEPHDDTDVLA